MDPPPDLECLSEEERNLILSVLQRDEELRSGLQNRACQVKQEVHELRMKSVLRNGDDLSKMCARCKTPFGFLFNSGDICPVCRFRVCKDCREKTLNSQGWMCSLCFKENQLKWLSNENLADDSDDENEGGGGKERVAADSDIYPHSTPPLTNRGPTPLYAAHEAERQRTTSTSEQSEQSDREKPAATDGLSEEEGALSPAQRSNSMGDLLGNGAPTGSQMHYKKRALAGSMDQLNHDAEDDIDGAVSRYRKRGKPLSRSRFSLAASRESLVSVYSSAGEVNYGRIPVSGEITFGLHYDQRQSALKIHLKGCHDLAPVDTKHNRSDPYVKTYLLPDKTRSGKRKSKIKKRTLNPDYNETLSYTISPGELETRTLWVTVWHSDRFGRNDFLGEVSLPMDMELFDDTSPQTYPLQSRTADDLSETALQYKGEVILSLMYLTPDNAQAARKEAPKKSKSRFKKSKKTSATSPPMGEVHVLIKSAKHLMAVRSNGSSDAFVKGYLLPDRSRAGKQKTPVVKNSLNPMWNHILVFEGVDSADLADRSLELTVWDHEKLGTNEFLGGTRLNLGSGTAKGGQQVDWMDSRGEESAVWRNMMDQPNTWVDAALHLRPSMSKGSAKH